MPALAGFLALNSPIALALRRRIVTGETALLIAGWRVEGVTSAANPVHEVGHVLLDLIRALPAEIRAVFILRDVEGLSTAETATALGIGEGLVKWRLHHARKRLRERLAEHALSDVS